MVGSEIADVILFAESARPFLCSLRSLAATSVFRFSGRDSLGYLRAGFTIEEIFNLTKIDRWFLVQIKESVDFEEEMAWANN